MKSLKIKYIYNKYKFELIITVVLFLTIHLTLLASTFQGDYIDSEKASSFGAFVGGYFGAIFSLFSIVLLYISLREQTASTRLDQFENRFYEMIRLHRQNVSELEINDYIRDKKVFIALIEEFRCIRAFVSKQDLSLLNQKEHNLFVISFLILFFGIGDNSNRMLKSLLQNYLSDSITDKLVCKFEKYKKGYKNSNDPKYKYPYFEGHQFRLGHYFRHLYQAISYLDSTGFLSDDQKISYAKLLRAQLSTYEQALFFINSISPLGLNWWRKGYIGNYGLVKNIPSDFFKKNEIDLKSYFPKSGSYSINKKCNHNDVYFEFETYGVDDDYKFLNGCVTKMGNNKQDELNSK